MKDEIWIVLASNLGRFSDSPMTMESEMFNKEEATAYAKKLKTIYDDTDFYLVEVDLTKREEVLQ